MIRRFDFNKRDFDRYIFNCAFSEDEEKIFSMRRRNVSIVAIALAMKMSESAVKRRLTSIHKKIEDENRRESGTKPP